MAICSAYWGSEGHSQGKEKCLCSQVSRDVEATGRWTGGQVITQEESRRKESRGEQKEKHWDSQQSLNLWAHLSISTCVMKMDSLLSWTDTQEPNRKQTGKCCLWHSMKITTGFNNEGNGYIRTDQGNDSYSFFLVNKVWVNKGSVITKLKHDRMFLSLEKIAASNPSD